MIGVSLEAVNTLVNMGNQLEELSAKIHSETEQLKTAYEENKSGLGYHVADIEKVIEIMEGTEEEGAKLVKKLVLKLNRAAKIRLDHINTKRYTDTHTETISKGRSR